MFREVLEDVATRVPKVENVVLAGKDGIIVASLYEGEGDDILAVEAAELVKESLRFGDEMGSGMLRHLAFHFEDRFMVIHMVGSEYFLVALIRDVNAMGKLRYLLKLKSYRCAELFS